MKVGNLVETTRHECGNVSNWRQTVVQVQNSAVREAVGGLSGSQPVRRQSILTMPRNLRTAR